ncbi:MAG TPA: hypothetical protein VIF62_28320 [Labilithrix sp.]
MPTLLALAVAGLNLGAPVWNGAIATDAIQAVVDAAAPTVRLNFRLDQWSSPNDTTKHGGKTFFEAYDSIVDSFVSQGIEVYGLLNDEVVSGSGDFDDAYAANALAVVDHFKDRVRVWETLNEPNDYAGGTSARYPAASFAEAHARVYDAVKAKHPNDACWDVKIVTGPLFSFDGTTAADYLDQTIAAGRASGTWKALRDALGRDPVDDVGYHLYVAQGSDSPIADVGAIAGKNLDAIHGVLAKYGLGDRRAWISEIGWQVPAVDEQGQADRLDATFASLGARDDVASIQWFTIADFGGAGWGLYRSSIAPGNERPAHTRFVAQAKAYAHALAAKLVVELPKQLTVGETVVAKVKATNVGKDAWTAADGVRLGAASGCPSAWATNAWTWEVASPSGYANAITDARRFLDASANVAQGEDVDLDVPLTAPKTPGTVRFAARMVKEGVAWFGATAIADVTIVAASASPPPGSTTPPGETPRAGAASEAAPPSANGGCGCREAPARDTGAGILVALAALALSRARRRS